MTAANVTFIQGLPMMWIQLILDDRAGIILFRNIEKLLKILSESPNEINILKMSFKQGTQNLTE